MPLVLLYTSPLRRSIKHLDPQQRETIAAILEAVRMYYGANADLAAAQKTFPGFFYKKLRHDLYEAGVEGKSRVIIRKEGSNCSAMFAGNHDQIRRFLSGN